MADDLWVLIDADGRFQQVHAPKGKRPYNPLRLKAHKVDRHTTDPDCERYDPATKEWVKDHAKRTRLDEEVRILTMTGPQVYGELRPMIDALSARVAKLEGRKS